MNIAYASDLHFEFQEYRILRLIELIDPSTDVLILAGDIQTSGRIILDLEYIHKELPNLDIVYVTGNHEFYGAKISDVETSLKVAFDKHPKIHYLERNTFEFNGVVFLGTTLWTGFDAYPQFQQETSEEDALHGIYDFKAISQGVGRFSPIHCKQMFQNNCQWLTKQLSEYHNQDVTTVVVTHFPPLPTLNHQHIKVSPLSNYFQANCSLIINQHKPNYWIYGHNHWSDDQQVNQTRILSNQLGYPNEFSNSQDMLKYFSINN